jgi:hypothetical protein
MQVLPRERNPVLLLSLRTASVNAQTISDPIGQHGLFSCGMMVEV